MIFVIYHLVCELCFSKNQNSLHILGYWDGSNTVMANCNSVIDTCGRVLKLLDENLLTSFVISLNIYGKIIIVEMDTKIKLRVIMKDEYG